VSVTVSAAEIAAGSADPLIVTVQVRRTDNGQPPPDGTTAIVSASLGALGSPGGPGSVVVALGNGVAQLQCFPGDVAGTAILQAQLQGSFGQAIVQIRAPETFFLSFVSPNVGTPQGGETVTIHGGGFESPVRVLFGAVNAQVVSAGATQIQVVTPPSPSAPNQQATVDVTVTINVNEDGQANDNLAGAFTYRPGGSTGTPAIFSANPAGGPNEGGTQVTIVGEGFEAPVQVLFGQGNAGAFEGQEATIESVTSTRIVVRSPAAQGIGQNNLNQLVAILVRNLDSGLGAVLQSAFQYGSDVLITAISPGGGSHLGGDLVIIHGQGFAAPVAVSIGGLTQTVISVTATEVVIRTTAASVADCEVTSPDFNENRGVVRLVNINTGDFAVGPLFEYFIPQPLIFGVAPPSGSGAGGTIVTITGSGFEAPVRVLFGGNAGTVLSSSTTSISARTPAFTGTFPTTACTLPGPMPGDPPVPGTQAQPASVAVQVINLATGCSNTLPGGFIYNPTTGCIPTGGGP
jgi:hypothetical protein